MTSNTDKEKVDAMPMPDSKRMKAAVVVPGLRATVAEDSMTEVLLRLTVKSVARCRAVCRSWAALLSSDEFCALYRAVARAASPVPKLLHFSPTAGFDATAAYARPLSPAPGPGQDERLFTLDYARGNRVEVLTPAPCHGLTLLYDAIARAYYVCNPATREHASLRCPAWDFNIVGMYPHAPTAEYRLLLRCCDLDMPKDEFGCYVLPLGSDQPPRYIGWLEMVKVLCIEISALIRDSLHWFLLEHRKHVLVFDTTAESFRHMRACCRESGVKQKSEKGLDVIVKCIYWEDSEWTK